MTDSPEDKAARLGVIIRSTVWVAAIVLTLVGASLAFIWVTHS